MRILAADTSTQLMHLALVTEKGTSSLCRDDGMHHSENLLPSILDLLKEQELKLKDLDLLACTAGPGSFTGLRIAMSAMKGISSATSIPLVSVSTMDLLASFTTFFPGITVTAIDARKKRFYIALYRGDKRLTRDMDCHESEVVQLLGDKEPVLITGPDSQIFQQKLIGAGVEANRLSLDDTPKDIGVQLAHLAERQFKEKGADETGTGPVYVRKSDAEIALEKKLQQLRAEG
jgi:tRNA threonylcarbamoyladenosine biosynthesis protein TsaB